jgi:hypothetical protein
MEGSNYDVLLLRPLDIVNPNVPVFDGAPGLSQDSTS